jgi:hypothetical protein
MSLNACVYSYILITTIGQVSHNFREGLYVMLLELVAQPICFYYICSFSNYHTTLNEIFLIHPSGGYPRRNINPFTKHVILKHIDVLNFIFILLTMVFEHYINDFPLEVIYIKPSKIANMANMIFVFCMIKLTFKITSHALVVVATDDKIIHYSLD